MFWNVFLIFRSSFRKNFYLCGKFMENISYRKKCTPLLWEILGRFPQIREDFPPYIMEKKFSRFFPHIWLTILVPGSVGKVLEAMLVVGLGQVPLQHLGLHPRQPVRPVLGYQLNHFPVSGGWTIFQTLIGGTAVGFLQHLPLKGSPGQIRSTCEYNGTRRLQIDVVYLCWPIAPS